MTPQEQLNEWIEIVEERSCREIDEDAKLWLFRYYDDLSRMFSSFPNLGSEKTPVGRNFFESLNLLADAALTWQRAIPHESGTGLDLQAVERGAMVAAGHCWLCP